MYIHSSNNKLLTHLTLYEVLLLLLKSFTRKYVNRRVFRKIWKVHDFVSIQFFDKWTLTRTFNDDAFTISIEEQPNSTSGTKRNNLLPRGWKKVIQRLLFFHEATAKNFGTNYISLRKFKVHQSSSYLQW